MKGFIFGAFLGITLSIFGIYFYDWKFWYLTITLNILFQYLDSNMGLLKDLYFITFEADGVTYSGNIEKGKIVGWDEVLERLKEKYNTKKIIITKSEKIG